ncbi:MAG: toll/interleukin-1 receptor domain-containing protein, partial [Bacteroidales bacterium]|nr:toll/interleukin-1 receptor domain-containing protein [Bacteroidales bacterium]
MKNEYEYDVFLSYARDDDEPFVKQLYDDLSANGYRVWWDRVCMPSRALKFTQEIRDAVEKSNRLLLIVG